MVNKKRSIMSKGWLIIGIVMLITGSGLIFLANSLYYESNQLENYNTNGEYNDMINEVSDHISTNARFFKNVLIGDSANKVLNQIFWWYI